MMAVLTMRLPAEFSGVKVDLVGDVFVEDSVACARTGESSACDGLPESASELGEDLVSKIRKP